MIKPSKVKRLLLSPNKTARTHNQSIPCHKAACLGFSVLPFEVSILRFPPNENPLGFFLSCKRLFLSITWTPEETSVIVPSTHIPAAVRISTIESGEPICARGCTCKLMIFARFTGWRVFKIDGPLDFSLIGIFASISSILASRKISIFAMSTYNTGKPFQDLFSHAFYDFPTRNIDGCHTDMPMRTVAILLHIHYTL